MKPYTYISCLPLFVHPCPALNLRGRNPPQCFPVDQGHLFGHVIRLAEIERRAVLCHVNALLVKGSLPKLRV